MEKPRKLSGLRLSYQLLAISLSRTHGRGGGVGRGLGVGVHLPVHGAGVGVGVGVAVGVAAGVDVGVGVGLGAPDCAQYLPPVLSPPKPKPPQMIISLPLHTAVCDNR